MVLLRGCSVDAAAVEEYKRRGLIDKKVEDAGATVMIEFVSGCYSPSSRRLIVGGTRVRDSWLAMRCVGVVCASDVGRVQSRLCGVWYVCASDV